MAKVYFISCRDAGVDCDFEARGSSLEEVMLLCADHGAQEHNMKAFGSDLYAEMRRCVKTLEEGPSGPTSCRAWYDEVTATRQSLPLSHLRAITPV